MDTVARLINTGKSMVSPKVGKDSHTEEFKKNFWRGEDPIMFREKGRSSQKRKCLSVQIPGQDRSR